jgi:hypothetical protein
LSDNETGLYGAGIGRGMGGLGSGADARVWQ